MFVSESVYERAKVFSAPSFKVTAVPEVVGASFTFSENKDTKVDSERSPFEFLTLYSKESALFSDPSCW